MTVRALRDTNNQNLIGTSNLGNIISATGAEKERLDKFSYEYFITYTPDQNGNTQTAKTSTVSGTTGGDISEGTTYKDSGTSESVFYNIYSCGQDSESNVITVLQSTVSVVN